jgi:hypothetical protein
MTEIELQMRENLEFGNINEGFTVYVLDNHFNTLISPILGYAVH